MTDYSSMITNETTKDEVKAKIVRLRKLSDEMLAEIERVIRRHVPDHHFMYHRIVPCSYGFFWECEESPVGLCVYNIEKQTGATGSCRWCGNPKERK